MNPYLPQLSRPFSNFSLSRSDRPVSYQLKASASPTSIYRGLPPPPLAPSPSQSITPSFLGLPSQLQQSTNQQTFGQYLPENNQKSWKEQYSSHFTNNHVIFSIY